MPTALDVVCAVTDVSLPLRNDRSTPESSKGLLVEYLHSKEERIKVVQRLFRGLGLQEFSQRFRATINHTPMEATTCQGRNYIYTTRGWHTPDVIVSAHYDHIGGKGAVDDASGLGVMHAVAEAMQKTRAKIWYVAFDFEEWALRGSRAFLATCKKGIFKNVALPRVFNIDAAGGAGTLCSLAPPACAQMKLVEPSEPAHCYRPLPGLPSVFTLGNGSTDANTFAAYHFPVSTTIAYGLPDKLPTPNDDGIIFLNAGECSTVCNTPMDNMDAVSEPNITRATDIIVSEIYRLLAGRSESRMDASCESKTSVILPGQ